MKMTDARLVATVSEDRRNGGHLAKTGTTAFPRRNPVHGARMTPTARHLVPRAPVTRDGGDYVADAPEKPVMPSTSDKGSLFTYSPESKVRGISFD